MTRLSLALLLVLAPVSARAFTIAADVYGAWLQNQSERDGVGANLRLGSGLDVPGLDLSLELGGTYAAFASGPGDLGADTLWAGFGGARLGFGEVLRPGAYAHVGYASYDRFEPFSDTPGSGGGLFGRAGLFLDLALPVLSVGADVAYDSFLTGDFGERPAWLTAGVHAALTF